jgi:hypothetical protein
MTMTRVIRLSEPNDEWSISIESGYITLWERDVFDPRINHAREHFTMEPDMAILIQHPGDEK